MFRIKFWYNPGEVEINTAEKISIRCSHGEKETMIDMDIMNTT